MDDEHVWCALRGGLEPLVGVTRAYQLGSYPERLEEDELAGLVSIALFADAGVVELHVERLPEGTKISMVEEHSDDHAVKVRYRSKWTVLLRTNDEVLVTQGPVVTSEDG